MLDSEYRARAREYVYQANLRRKSPNEQIKPLQMAIDMYQQIQEKMDEDYTGIAHSQRNIAITYFNLASQPHEKSREYYVYSGRHYLMSIQCYLDRPDSLNDTRYREITELYIDLSDVCCHLSDFNGAQDALKNAIRAFNKIKIKTDKEEKLGDPEHHPELLYQYFEELNSSTGYLTSTRFKNIQTILMSRYKEGQLAGQMSAVSMTEPLMDLENLVSMMTGLTMINENSMSVIAINIDKPCSDPDFRAVSIEYLRLTARYFEQGKIHDATISLKQALDALSAVHLKTAGDEDYIKKIATQIPLFEAQQSMHAMHISSAGSAAAAAAYPGQIQAGSEASSAFMGIFGSSRVRTSELFQSDLPMAPTYEATYQ